MISLWPDFKKFPLFGFFFGGGDYFECKSDVMQQWCKILIFTQLQNKTTLKTASSLTVILLLLIGIWLQSIRIPLSLLLCSCITVKCCPNYVNWIHTVDSPEAIHPEILGPLAKNKCFFSYSAVLRWHNATWIALSRWIMQTFCFSKYCFTSTARIASLMQIYSTLQRLSKPCQSSTCDFCIAHF